MKIIKTKGYLERSTFPTSLEWLREMNKRNALDKSLHDELYRLETGNVGEQFLIDSIEEFGGEHWVVIPNLWLKFNGCFECDLVLMTNAGIYTFEVKNYSGHYIFREMQCWMNGEKIGYSAIQQAQKSYIHLEKLINSNNTHTKVFGSLVFVGDHHTVEVHDQVNDLQIVMRNELRNYIWGIKKQERMYQGAPLDFNRYINLFEQYETHHSFGPKPITHDITERMQLGLCCSQCDNFDLVRTKLEISCRCGMHEPLENAIVRTICEYGVIHFDKELGASTLLHFFDGQVSRSTITRYLNQHFVKLGSGRSIHYLNPRLPFSKIAKRFDLNKPRYIVLNNSEVVRSNE